jgi:hypothetical protein
VPRIAEIKRLAQVGKALPSFFATQRVGKRGGSGARCCGARHQDFPHPIRLFKLSHSEPQIASLVATIQGASLESESVLKWSAFLKQQIKVQ